MKRIKKLAAALMAAALFLLLMPAGVKAAAGTFTVHYDANSGTGHMDDQLLVIGSTQQFSANSYSRSGYQFTGWNTESNGSGIAVADQAAVTALTDQVGVTTGSTVNLYAQWKKNSAPTTAPAPSGTSGEVREGNWCITYLDCSGNTVSVQWVRTGGSPEKPAGYNYPDVYDVSAHQDIRPVRCSAAGFVAPDTADRS